MLSDIPVDVWLFLLYVISVMLAVVHITLNIGFSEEFVLTNYVLVFVPIVNTVVACFAIVTAVAWVSMKLAGEE